MDREKCPEFRVGWGKKTSEHYVPIFVNVDTLVCLYIYVEIDFG